MHLQTTSVSRRVRSGDGLVPSALADMLAKRGRGRPRSMVVGTPSNSLHPLTLHAPPLHVPGARSFRVRIGPEHLHEAALFGQHSQGFCNFAILEMSVAINKK